MKIPWPFSPIAAGSLPLGPIVRVTVALLVAAGVTLALLLLRSSAAIGELGADFRSRTEPMLAEREKALAALGRITHHAGIVLHADDAAVRRTHLDAVAGIVGSRIFDFDGALKLRVLNAGSALREIGERLELAAIVEGQRGEPARVRRLRDEAWSRWRDTDQALAADARMLAATARVAVSARLDEIEVASQQQQTMVLRVIGVMVATLLVASFLLLRVLLAPILHTVRALAAVDAHQSPPPLPASPLAEIDAIYRAVEHHAYALRQAEALAWRSIAVDASANAVVIANAQGVIEYVNPAFTTITGYSREEAIGQTPRVLKSGAHDPGFYEQFWKTILSGKEWRGELVNRRRDGTLFNDLMTVSPVLDDRGRVVRFIAIHYDITRRKEVEGQLRGRTADLQRYRQQREAEDAMARSIMERQLHHEDLHALGVQAWQMPATQFSGDIVAARRAPGGHLFVLLGDATGHGLAAAICVLPLLARFEELVDSGRDLRGIVAALDQGMRATMPIGHFVAATLLSVDRTAGEIDIWQGGMPGLLLIDGEGKEEDGLRRIIGRDLALGVMERRMDEYIIDRLACPPTAQIALYSDGLIEATSDGASFSAAMLEHILSKQPAAARLAAVRSNLLLHMNGRTHHDDVSLVLIDGGAVASGKHA